MRFIFKMLFQKFLSIGICTLNGWSKIFPFSFWQNCIVCKAGIFGIKFFFSFTFDNKSVFNQSFVKFFGILFNCFFIYINKWLYDFFCKFVQSLWFTAQSTQENCAAFVYHSVVPDSSWCNVSCSVVVTDVSVFLLSVEHLSWFLLYFDIY